MRKRLGRFGAVIQKEMIQLLRDRRTLALLLTLPLLQLFLFAYAVELTVSHIPTAVADMSLDGQSQALINALQVSGFFDVEMYLEDEAKVIRAIDEGRVKAGLVIPPDFATQVERGRAQALFIFDGSDSFTVQSGYSAAVAVAQAHAIKLVVQKIGRLGTNVGLPALSSPETLPISTSTRVLYNPNLDDMIFIVPALAALLLQVFAVNLTAMAVVREREMGTLEQLLITPVRPMELMVGKMLPNFFVASFNLLSITLAGIFWFGVPFQGNPWLFAWLSVLFIISGLGLGLLVSTVSQTQHQAQQIGAMLMLLSMLLTGFIYPREPMPILVQAVGDLLPLTYFIRIARGIFTKGIGLSFLWRDVVALGIYATVVLAVAAVTFKKRLD